jgi:molybdopterin/thiamine biosynthesis adenylyltransferase
LAELTDHERILYNRQMLIDGWGSEGQLGLKTSTVFIAGAGGLGSPVSIYLAVAGVGELKVCDADTIELSNLNRQILHGSGRIGELKALSASKTLTDLNPAVKVVSCSDFLDENNVQRIVGQPDLVVDCLDNFGFRSFMGRCTACWDKQRSCFRPRHHACDASFPSHRPKRSSQWWAPHLVS